MDPISDMLTRIRNANSRKKESLSMPHSNIKGEIAELMQKNGYLLSVETKELPNKKKDLVLKLRYENDEPVIVGIKRISKPGQRIYSDSLNFEKIGGRRGMMIISTSKGLKSHFRARKEKLGGEIMAVVY